MGSPSHPGPPLAPAVVRPKDTRLPSRRRIKMESRRNRRSRSHGAGRPIGELRYRSDDVGGATHKSTSTKSSSAMDTSDCMDWKTLVWSTGTIWSGEGLRGSGEVGEAGPPGASIHAAPPPVPGGALLQSQFAEGGKPRLPPERHVCWSGTSSYEKFLQDTSVFASFENGGVL